jgi:hypothetical protein
MTPPERARACRQRKAAQAPLPANVIRLKPRKIAAATPAIVVAELR